MANKEKLPAIHLYPGDWLRDAIAGCSLAAQGLWLRMMFVAHDSTRYGYLELNGSVMQPETIARRCGCDLAEYESLLCELVDAGVPSVSDAGALFSRRMVRDANIRAKRVSAGRKGGRAPRSNIEANGKQNHEDEVEDESLFEMFWQSFPRGRKRSKAPARESFLKALGKTDAATIIAAAKEYADSDAGRGQYVKMPSSWLNQECWNDDREAWRDQDKPAGEVGYRKVSAEQFAEYVANDAFKEKHRHATDRKWVYGTLRDGTKVECKNYDR